MQKFFLPFLQKALNHYLQLDPESKSRLRELKGKKVTIELLKMNLIFQLHFTDEAIEIVRDGYGDADTYIKGTPLSLLRLAMTEGDRKHFFKDDVSIEGDLDLGQQVIDLFDHLEIDWEEYLSHWIGDVPAHQVGRFVGKLQDFSARVRKAFVQNVNEYVHEEAEYVPTAEAIENFFKDVDTIRMDVDRIDARIQRIKQAIKDSK